MDIVEYDTMSLFNKLFRKKKERKESNGKYIVTRSTMKIGSIKCDTLLSILKNIVPYSDSAYITFSDDLVKISAVDPPHILLVNMNLSTDLLTGYENIRQGIGFSNIVEMVHFLKHKKDASASMEMKLQKGEFVLSSDEITIIGPIIDFHVEVPELDFPCEVIMDVPVLKKIVKDMYIYFSFVQLAMTPDSFIIRGLSEKRSPPDDIHPETILVRRDLVGLSCDEKVQSMFDSGYLLKIVEDIDGSNFITIRLGADSPIQLEYTIFDNKATIRYLLAPRIDE